VKKYLLLVLLAALSPAFATTVQNLDSVPSAIQHPEGKQIFAEQMAGATPAKGFGELPQGLSENAWIAWVAPNEDPDNLILTGAKAWGKDGKYIGVACFADNPADAGQAKKYADNNCPENYSNGRANKLYLGVFSWQNQQLTPIARSEKPLNQLSEWNKTAEKESDDESSDRWPIIQNWIWHRTGSHPIRWRLGCAVDTLRRIPAAAHFMKCWSSMRSKTTG